ncbi:MAG: SLC13 family permease [Oscillospiraceae bacterium]
MKIKRFIREEAVLTAAVVLAVLSACFVRPDAQYIDYIDFRTLGILFSLMTVMAGLRRQGVFARLGQALLARAGGMLRLVFVLVGLCFFGSMFITNDVALMTFVPFTFAVLGGLGEETRRRFAPPVVCMQTVAANLGSMLTPIGNPQNLYLYGKSGMSLGRFIGLMLPYSAVSLALLALWAVLLCRGQKGAPAPAAVEAPAAGSKKLVEMYGLLFAFCLLAVARVVPYPAVFGVVLLCALCADRATLRRVDYSLLLTFAAFFVFTGNLGRVPAFSSWLRGIIAGREVPVAVLASQVISNVPAALLLSGFTGNTEALIIGTDLGGLGTLIASMASLISYRQIARELPGCKGRYFGLFTLSNLIFLALLLALWAAIGR